jgi:S2P endopeptidase
LTFETVKFFLNNFFSEMIVTWLWQIVVVWLLFFVSMKVLNAIGCYTWFEEHIMNLSVRPFYVQWYTTRFNGFFAWCVSSSSSSSLNSNKRERKWFFQQWFFVGAAVGLLALGGAVLVLFANLSLTAWRLCYVLYRRSLVAPGQADESIQSMLDEGGVPDMLLTPVVPGLNVPLSHLVHFFGALLVAGVAHEAGHALAAAAESVRLNGFGVFVMFVYPGAFADIGDELVALPALRQLKIYCAGAWHNVALAVVASLALLALPVLLWPLYAVPSDGGGAVVIGVAERSPLAPHLSAGDIVASLDDCSLLGAADTLARWTECFERLASRGDGERGSCASAAWVRREHLMNGAACCNETAPALQCFALSDEQRDAPTRVCTSARGLLADDRPCALDRDCLPPDGVCLRAVLPESSMRIVKIGLAHTKPTEPNFILFAGDLPSLWFAISVGELRPRIGALPVALPSAIATFLQYLTSLSAALGLLNMAPAYMLDGQHALHALLAFLLPNADERSRALRQRIAIILLRVTSLLFIGNIILTFIDVYIQS